MAPKITLYKDTAISPNPIKIMILLEELDIEYTLVLKEMGDGPNGVKAPDYLKINPNGRLPAIVDHTNNDFVVWESGAILLYLAERFDTNHRLSGTTLEERTEILEWLMFQMSGLGPSQGQVAWFLMSHPVKPPELHPSVIDRYKNETRRIYGVLEKRLEETGEFLALGRFTIVDMANVTWLNVAHLLDLRLDDFPRLKAYLERIKTFPSVERAYAKTPRVPSRNAS